jgi:ribosome biogenesis GTPase
VRAAVDTGTIDPDRLQRWRKLIAEDRHNNETLHEARIRSRSFGKTVKAAPSGKGRKR